MPSADRYVPSRHELDIRFYSSSRSYAGANTLQYKAAKPDAVYFAPKESPRGYGAFHYVEEGNVDNFEYAADKDQMIYNPEGLGMGKPVLYKRCR